MVVDAGCVEMARRNAVAAAAVSVVEGAGVEGEVDVSGTVDDDDACGADRVACGGVLDGCGSALSRNCVSSSSMRWSCLRLSCVVESARASALWVRVSQCPRQAWAAFSATRS